tara:strand:- start:4089 stop:4262 length:174 start_codon:yes stop_codon:yes gene_type:complete
MVDCGCAFCTGNPDPIEEHFENTLDPVEEGRAMGFWNIFLVALLLVSSAQIGVILWR